MIGLQFHNTIATKAIINGPILTFVGAGLTEPVSITTCAALSASFTGFATAFFTGSQVPDLTNAGIVTYRWYEVGVGPLSDSANVTGSGTTVLTLTNLRTPQDSGRRFYLQADYLSSVSAGGTFVGNAINDPLNSQTATLTVLPNLSFTRQPSAVVIAENSTATFTVEAGTTDPTQTGSFIYQWTLDGQNLEDRTYVLQQQVNQFNQTYSNDASVSLASDAFDINLTVAGARGGNGGSDAGGPGGGGGAGRVGTFTLTPGGRTLDLRCGDSGSSGGSGNFPALGPAGASSVAAGGRGGGAGPGGWSGGGGGGGGASGVYDSSTGGYVIIAGGGGGGGGGSLGRGGGGASSALDWTAVSSNIPASSGGQGQDQGGDGGGGGGGGGGTTSGTVSAPVSFVVSSSQNITFSVTESSGFFNGLEIVGVRYFPENAGTITLFVSAGTYAVIPRDSTVSVRVAPGNSRVVQGDDGGGSWDDVVVSASAGTFTSSTVVSGNGGGAGGDNSSGGAGGGGGASAYNSNVATLTSGSSSTNSGDGYINLQYKSATAIGTVVTTSKTRVVSGSNTNTLRITSNAVGLSTVRCVVSRANSCNSPILSEVVNYNVITSREIVNFEEIFGSSLLRTGNQNLTNGSLTIFGDPGNNMKNIILYPNEKDVTVRITLAGSAGLSNGSNRGGNGGVTTFQYVLRRNREYNIILGVTGVTGPGGNVGGGVGAFFYDGGKVIVCCGGGGGAGSGGRGGDGGGSGIVGENGLGLYGGSGGSNVTVGTLPGSGFFAGGSYTTQSTSATTGGRLSSCTIGDAYFTSRFSACADMGSSQFRDAAGNIVSGTATLTRGFKPGLSHRTNGGNGSGTNGGGGQGAIGGNGGGGSGSGGGGGSGYSSGDATIVTSTLGGNTSTTGYAIIQLA